MSPITMSEFTITVETTGWKFVLTAWDVTDAVKEYIVNYQTELKADGRYEETDK